MSYNELKNLDENNKSTLQSMFGGILITAIFPEITAFYAISAF